MQEEYTELNSILDMIKWINCSILHTYLFRYDYYVYKTLI